MNTAVDEYLKTLKVWHDECVQLRRIVLDCQLTEELKWGKPCYSYLNTNMVIIVGFKHYCTLGFFTGDVLSDEHGLLIKPGENTQAGRQIRFTSVTEILEKESILKAYIFEAIEANKAGIKIEYPQKPELQIPEELQKKWDEDSVFKNAFEALTPGRQRMYIVFFSEPKQSKTREARIEKYTDRILKNKGLTDCICGLSKKMPNCDGSHKVLKQV